MKSATGLQIDEEEYIVQKLTEIGASEEAMAGAAEDFYPPLYHAINRTRLRVSEFKRISQ